MTRDDGVLDVWDIIQQQKHASLSVKVCDEPLTCIRTHEGGRLVAVGNKRGTTYLVEFSENLSVTHKNDKAFMTQVIIIIFHWNLDDRQWLFFFRCLKGKLTERRLWKQG